MSAQELSIEALVDNLPQVMQFTEECLETAGCPIRAQMQISLAVEEIFVNIASYAYASEGKKGQAVIRVETAGDPERIEITFMDWGVPYNPLEKEDPDVSASSKERKIGGLGIFLTKKSMDDVSYEYRDSMNILKLTKLLGSAS